MKRKLGLSFLIVAFLILIVTVPLPNLVGLEPGSWPYILFVCSFDILIGIGAAIYLSDKFTKPLRQLTDVASEISQGDLTKEVSIATDDEVGQLAQSFQQMVVSLRQVVGEMVRTAHAIYDSAQNLSATSEEMNASTDEVADNIVEIARGADEQARMVAKTSMLTSDLAKSLQEMEEKARKAAKFAIEANEKAHQGGKAAISAQEKMDQIVKQTEVSTGMVEGFRTSALDINDAVDMINSIAHQTHLLALNATIEAARAGEHGRGFAVVAEEIRNLADNAQGFADGISELAQKINAESEEVLKAMHDSTQAALTGREVVSTAGKNLEEIVTVVVCTRELVENIAEMTRKQAKSAETMVKLISEIHEIAQGNAGSTQQVSAATQQQTASMEDMAHSAQELARTSDTLKDLTANFHINEFGR